MSVLGLFVLRGLLVTLAVRQPFVVMNGPSSSRVAMNVDNTVSAAKQLKQPSVEVRARDRSHARMPLGLTPAVLSLSLDHR